MHTVHVSACSGTTRNIITLLGIINPCQMKVTSTLFMHDQQTCNVPYAAIAPWPLHHGDVVLVARKLY